MAYDVEVEKVAMKLKDVVESLATGRGGIRERLSEVKAELEPIGLNQMPTAHAGSMWRRVRDALDNFDLLSEDDAVKMASEVFALYFELDVYAQHGA